MCIHVCVYIYIYIHKPPRRLGDVLTLAASGAVRRDVPSGFDYNFTNYMFKRET